MAAHPFIGKTVLRITWLAARTTSALSTRLSGLLAARLWFTPWQVTSPRRLAREAEWLAGTEPLTLETPLGRMSGFSAGAGPTVLLVHG